MHININKIKLSAGSTTTTKAGIKPGVGCTKSEITEPVSNTLPKTACNGRYSSYLWLSAKNGQDTVGHCFDPLDWRSVVRETSGGPRTLESE